MKVKIKSAISDEFQTLIFYEIEDTEADNQYGIMFGDGVFVENEIDLMNTDVYPLNYPPDLESAINKEKRMCTMEKWVYFQSERITEQLNW